MNILTLIDFTTAVFFFFFFFFFARGKGGLFLGFYCLFMFEMCWKLVYNPISNKVTIVQQGYIW